MENPFRKLWELLNTPSRPYAPKPKKRWRPSKPVDDQTGQPLGPGQQGVYSRDGQTVDTDGKGVPGDAFSSLIPSAQTLQNIALATVVIGVLAATGVYGAVAMTSLAATQLAGADPQQPHDPSLHPDKVVGSRRNQEPATKQLYLLVKVENMGFRGGGIYSIRSENDLNRGIAYSSYRHGGNSSEPAPYVKIAGPCSLQEAQQILISKIQPNTMRNAPLAGGLVAKVDGGDATIDDWGAVDANAVRTGVNK